MTTLLSNWVFVASLAYCFQAVAAIGDKFLLEKKIALPSTYVFYVGVFGVFALFLYPFGFFVPSFFALFLATISGFISVVAFYFFFVVLQKSDASRIVPIIGGFSPIFVLLLSRMFLWEELNGPEFAAFFLLIAGGVLISLAFAHDGIKVKKPETKKIFLTTVFASFLFALTFVLFKASTDHTPFINAFIWSRLGGFFASLFFLLPMAWRAEILRSPSSGNVKTTGGLFLFNKLSGAIGFFLVDYAISIGHVSVVNAMQGVQYVLVFFFALILSRKFPSILREDFGLFPLVQKAGGIVLVAGGLAVLAFWGSS
ncbi:MAG: hypothetical protein A2934_02570 [Candidatus Sungbacteria bacterium RIFCSPLOWO2_01_FULL_47_10]|uniref:Uncharacterized protein n=1 Tax=Candidatus Sungbacteria bacterium RIFCSPLOWO2_01_FULL_47_10 TaxID=1802276 RepID=A0A1G2L5M8_9BACT|nr:MAG: hypothetical protein A2934_02570 [Candidatus Sungbacteria bacterium RIFCSPLOWO2_01_FULL_47_10]